MTFDTKISVPYVFAFGFDRVVWLEFELVAVYDENAFSAVSYRNGLTLIWQQQTINFNERILCNFGKNEIKGRIYGRGPLYAYIMQWTRHWFLVITFTV